MIPQLSTAPPKRDAAVFIPTIMPEPMMAGVHSRNQPQFSTYMAELVYLEAMKNQVKKCQSQRIPTAKFETILRTRETPNAIPKTRTFLSASLWPPEATWTVALVCMIAFSLGPNSPPRSGKVRGTALLMAFTMANPRIAPKRFAGNVIPVLSPFEMDYVSASDTCNVSLN